MSKAGETRDKKRIEGMGHLQNKLVKVIDEVKLPIPDLHMVLTVLIKQVEGIFISQLQTVKKDK